MLDAITTAMQGTLAGLKLKPRQVNPQLFVGYGPQRVVAPTRLELGWTKKTPFMNRGVGLLVVDAPGTPVSQVVGAHKDQVGEQLGYLPFLYVMALHLVIVGPGLNPNVHQMDGLTDKVNTMSVNLLTLHVADTVTRQVVSTKSWNAFFSSKIAAGIDQALHHGMHGAPRAAQGLS